MPTWSEDFSKFTLEDLFRSQAENRLWQKELRLRAANLVNTRLAKTISQEEYILNRNLAEVDSLECKRRATVLVNEITIRYTPSYSQPAVQQA